MKTQNWLPIGALAALIGMTTGCGALKVSIKSSASTSTSGASHRKSPPSEQDSKAAPSPSTASAFTGANSKTIEVKVRPRGTPNPRLEKLLVLATINPKKAGFACGFGDAVSTAPNALVTIEPGAENLAISARTPVAGLLLSKDGRFFCALDESRGGDKVTLKPNGLSAGTYELRVLLKSTMAKRSVEGQGYQPHDYPVVVAFSDPSRGQTYDEAVERVQLAEAPKAPLFFTGTTKSTAGFYSEGRRCKGTYGPMPHAIFSSERPIGDVSFRPLWAPTAFELRLQELPAGDKAPRWEGRCGDAQKPVLAARNLDGRVAIHIGARGQKGAGSFGYVVLGADTIVDPFLLSPLALPPRLEIADRQLGNHFPFLNAFLGRSSLKFSEKAPRRGSEVDKLRQRMFMTAPKPLFVTPKYDLDKNSTSRKAGDFPKQGETLLILEAPRRKNFYVVLRADGSRWLVLPKALAHPQRLSVPERSRRSFDEDRARGKTGPEDAALLAKAREADEKYKKCFNRATAAANRQVDAIDNSRLHWTTYNKRRKRSIWRAASTAAERRCGKAKLKPLHKKTNEQLVAARTERINVRLRQIAKRLDSL